MVLLTGLPGDIESENTFREQLKDWLEILSGGGKASKLYLLCDDPSSVTLPPRPEGKVIKGDRAGFVSLGPMLAGQTNALVVIAWGHGGRQGSTPVFHVRGPRITAADFKALASQVAAPESRWILMFPGSGAFAGQLAGEHRQILASECETMFTSDPIGMGVLLKLVRDQPSLSFEALSQAFGRATAAWYSQRSLARTEEPTLWAGTAHTAPAGRRVRDQFICLAPSGGDQRSARSATSRRGDWGARIAGGMEDDQAGRAAEIRRGRRRGAAPPLQLHPG